MFSDKLGPNIIGHIPRVTSNCIWYAMVKGAAVTAHATNARSKRLSLIQGRLEILTIVTVGDNADGVTTLKEKVESVNFPIGLEDEEYKDESDAILETIGTEEYEDSDYNMWRVFCCVPLLQISICFGEELISHIWFSFTLNKLTLFEPGY